MAAGVVHLPIYATGFRGDQIEQELERLSAVSLRYGATRYQVFRGRDDRYAFLVVLHFEQKIDWERYWEGPECTDFRIACQGWFQVPVVYGWKDLVCEGGASAPHSNGATIKSAAV